MSPVSLGNGRPISSLIDMEVQLSYPLESPGFLSKLKTGNISMITLQVHPVRDLVSSIRDLNHENTSTVSNLVPF